uniref:GDSL esterase/lipase n=1 Tax=Aegilops tauschii subsp. strangulata TaxID=200361 RepID=A0A453P0L6_AEGTS
DQMASPALLRYLVVLLLLVGCPGWPVPPSPASSSSPPRTVDGITAIYNFGDSISDTGNFIREGAVGLMEHTGKLPYGSAIGGPTGRCSDGYLMIDFLAQDLGLPLLSPYLDTGADFTHGVNFAVTGATALDTAALARIGVNMTHTNSSLAVQLQRFKDFMASAAKTPWEVREKLASSLVMVGEIGGNDYNYAFGMNSPQPNGGLNNIGRMITGAVESLALVPLVVKSITGAAKELLDMGLPRGRERDGPGGVRRQRLPHRAQPLRTDAQRAAAAGHPGAAPALPVRDHRLRRLLLGLRADAEGRVQDGLRRGGRDQGVLRRGRRRVQLRHGQDLRSAGDGGVREAGRAP